MNDALWLRANQMTEDCTVTAKKRERKQAQIQVIKEFARVQKKTINKKYSFPFSSPKKDQL